MRCGAFCVTGAWLLAALLAGCTGGQIGGRPADGSVEAAIPPAGDGAAAAEAGASGDGAAGDAAAGDAPPAADALPAGPTVEFASVSALVTETAGQVRVRVAMAPPAAVPVTVSYTTAGTATGGADYTITAASASPITIAAGDSSFDVLVDLVADGVDEAAETITFTLTDATGAVLGARRTHTVTIAGADVLDAVCAGCWYEIPGTRMDAVVPTPMPEGSWSGYGSIMGAWSGGAFDPSRDRFIVWGGGHHDYSGNEVYAFDLGARAWLRLTDPSVDVGGDEASGYYPDGRPRSRHTYDYVEYLPPPADRFCSFGGAALYPSGQIGIANVDCFDFGALAWARRADTPTPGIGAFCAWDSVGQRLWLHGTGSGAAMHLSSYDPVADTWAVHAADPSGWTSYSHTAAVDPVGRRFVAVGGGLVRVWDLAQPANAPVDVTTTGGDPVVAENNPGLAWHPGSSRLVGWSGGADVYTLDLDTLAWARRAPDAASPAVPTAPLENGTYGRFRYSPARDLFVLVNAVDQNVFVYRLAP